MIIKHKLNLSDEETVLQIQENAYLQYFLGYSSYEEKPVFSPTLFVEIRKRIGMKQFEELHTLIIKEAQAADKKITKKKRVKKQKKNNAYEKDKAEKDEAEQNEVYEGKETKPEEN